MLTNEQLISGMVMSLTITMLYMNTCGLIKKISSKIIIIMELVHSSEIPHPRQLIIHMYNSAPYLFLPVIVAQGNSTFYMDFYNYFYYACFHHNELYYMLVLVCRKLKRAWIQ